MDIKSFTEVCANGTKEEAYGAFLTMLTEMVVGHSMELEWYGTTYELKLRTDKYRENENLAIQLYCKNTEEDGEVWWEPFATLTVNAGTKHGENITAIDTNNCPFAEELIKKYLLGEETEMIDVSGFCIYPVYSMNPSALEWFSLDKEED